MTKDVRNNVIRDDVVLVPPADIYENEECFVLRCEMPGVGKGDVEATINNNELIITGRVNPEEGEDRSPVYSEYSLRNYQRKFRVDENINAPAITAALENGVLTVTLPKSERVKPRKIEIAFEK